MAPKGPDIFILFFSSYSTKKDTKVTQKWPGKQPHPGGYLSDWQTKSDWPKKVDVTVGVDSIERRYGRHLSQEKNRVGSMCQICW